MERQVAAFPITASGEDHPKCLTDKHTHFKQLTSGRQWCPRPWAHPGPCPERHHSPVSALLDWALLPVTQCVNVQLLSAQGDYMYTCTYILCYIRVWGEKIIAKYSNLKSCKRPSVRQSLCERDWEHKCVKEQAKSENKWEKNRIVPASESYINRSPHRG